MAKVPRASARSRIFISTGSFFDPDLFDYATVACTAPKTKQERPSLPR